MKGVIKELKFEITSHFGKNPVNGGSPPKERSKVDSAKNLKKLEEEIDEKSLEEFIFKENRNKNKIALMKQ